MYNPIYQNSKKWSFPEFICTLNFITLFIGFHFISALFALCGLDVTASSGLFTVPFRVFSVLLSFLTIFYGWGNLKKLKHPIIYILILSVAVYYLRIVFDISGNLSGYMTSQGEVIRVLGLSINSILGAFSIYLTFPKINLKAAFISIFFISLFICIMRALGVGTSEFEMTYLDASNIRAEVGIVNTITLGYIGAIGLLMMMYICFTQTSILVKIFSLACGVFFLSALLTAGSRSPIIALAIAMAFYISSYLKNYIFTFLLFALLMLVVFSLRFYLIDMLADIAPLLAKRFENMLLEGDTSGRFELIILAINNIGKYPMLGSSMIIPEYGLHILTGYHSILANAFAYYGIFMGPVVLAPLFYSLYVSIKIMENKNIYHLGWIALLAVLYCAYAIIAGGLYFSNTTMFSIIMLVFAYYKYTRDAIERIQ